MESLNLVVQSWLLIYLIPQLLSYNINNIMSYKYILDNKTVNIYKNI